VAVALGLGIGLDVPAHKVPAIQETPTNIFGASQSRTTRCHRRPRSAPRRWARPRTGMLQYTGDRDMQTLGSPRVVGASPHVYDHTFSCAWRHGCAAPAAAHPSCLSWGHTPPACGARPTTNISVRRVVFGSAARQHTGRSPALSGCKRELSVCVCVCVCDFNGWRRRAGHPPAEEVVGVALGCKGGLVHGRHLARKFRRHGAQLDHARRLVHAVRLRFPPPLTAIVQPAPTPHPHTQVSRPSRTHAHHQQALP